MSCVAHHHPGSRLQGGKNREAFDFKVERIGKHKGHTLLEAQIFAKSYECVVEKPHQRVDVFRSALAEVRTGAEAIVNKQRGDPPNSAFYTCSKTGVRMRALTSNVEDAGEMVAAGGTTESSRYSDAISSEADVDGTETDHTEQHEYGLSGWTSTTFLDTEKGTKPTMGS